MDAMDNVFLQLTDIIQNASIRCGIKPPVAADVAAAVTTEIRKYMRNNSLYFAGMTHGERKARRGQIKSDFNGKNYDEVCRKYQISRRTLYRALSCPNSMNPVNTADNDN
jgi:Mor family transcriptional regulator